MHPTRITRLRRLIFTRRFLLLCSLSPLLLLLIAEIAVRFADWKFGQSRAGANPSLFLVQSDPIVGYRMTPNVYATYFTEGGGRIKIVTNSHGLHDEEFPTEKPEGEFRILCLGGSSTFAAYPVRSYRHAWPKKLQQALQQRHPRVRVINAGMMSYTTYESRRLLESRLISLSPDLILINQGWNDLKLMKRMTPDWTWQPTVHPEPDFATRLLSHSRLFVYLHWELQEGPHTIAEAAEVSTARKSSPLDQLPDFAFSEWEQEVDRLVAYCRARNIPVVFVDPLCLIKEVSESRSEERQIQSGLDAIAPLTRRGIIDASTEVRRRLQSRKDALYCALDTVPENLGTMVDVCHLTPYGAILQGEAIARFLDEHKLVP